MPHDDWDEPELPPDWGGGGGYDVQPDDGGSGQMLEQQQKPEGDEISFGDWSDIGAGHEGEHDQDCCDAAKDQFNKAVEKNIQENIHELTENAEREHLDGKTMDEHFEEQMAQRRELHQMISEIRETESDFLEGLEGDPFKDIQEQWDEAKVKRAVHIRENVQSNIREKTAMINAMECMQFKQFIKELRNHPTEDSSMDLGEVASAVYQEWMDCSGSDFDDGDDDMVMMGEPMDVAFSILKSQRLIDALLKLDWDDEPETSTTHERIADAHHRYNSRKNKGGKTRSFLNRDHQVHPVRDVNTYDEQKEPMSRRPPRGQHGTTGFPSGGNMGIRGRDKFRQANKIARARYLEDTAAKRARRMNLNRRDAKTTHHPGSIFLDADNPEEDHLPGRLAHDAKTGFKMDHHERNTLRDDIDWKQWMKLNPDKLQAILSGEHTLNDIFRPGDAAGEVGEPGKGRGWADNIAGEDRFTFGFVHDHTPTVTDIHEAHDRGNLPSEMTHEINLGQDWRGRDRAEHRGKIQGDEELREYLAELADAPTATRRSANMRQETDDDDEPVVPGIRQGIPSGEDTSWEGGGFVDRPTFWGVPFNEETGFTTGEPMDIAWDSLLKSSKLI